MYRLVLTVLVLVLLVTLQVQEGLTDGSSGMGEVVTVSVTVPTFAELGQTVVLQCHWNISRGNLYSLKWYLDDQEFFAFLPSDYPPKTVHEHHGLNVNVGESNEHEVVLVGVEHSATGRYKCEVISESPQFYTADKAAYMTVVKIPSERPIIFGGKREYHIGDIAHLTCISAPSRPAAALTWYINEKEAPSEYLVDLASRRRENGDIESRRGLQFSVGGEHFRDGQMNLRCSARISSMYHQTRHHNTDTHPHNIMYTVPVMESRDYSATAGSKGIMAIHHNGVTSILFMVIFSVLNSLLFNNIR